MICKDCPYFNSYGITPSAYVHYNELDGDMRYWEFSQKDGEVGICKHPIFGNGKDVVSCDECHAMIGCLGDSQMNMKKFKRHLKRFPETWRPMYLFLHKKVKQ